MAKAKKRTPVVVKKRSWPSSVMEHLMRQAYEEDYRRERMAEAERSAWSHLTDFGGRDGD